MSRALMGGSARWFPLIVACAWSAANSGLVWAQAAVGPLPALAHDSTAQPFQREGPHPRDDDLAAHVRLDDLDLYIRRAMADWQIPGLALAVVKDDEVVFMRAYGTRQAGRDAPVDLETLFPLASTTKSFTALAVAMLVDEGRLAWDDPVTRYLPWLELADPWITRTVTVRDLLSHRVAGGWGGSSYPFILVVGHLAPDEILRRMRHLGGDGSGFRSRFEYDNANYFAAAELVAAVSDVSWEEFVRSRILEPLGIRSARVGHGLWHERALIPCSECGLDGHTVGLEDARVPNIAVAHRWGESGPVTAPDLAGDARGAAGIVADIRDVAIWLRFQLGRGETGGTRLLRAETFDQMHAPQVAIPAAEMQDLRPDAGNLWAHGFGWYLTDYRGRKAVMHGGGFAVNMAMLPEEGLGVAVLANMPNQLRQALAFHIFDRYLGEAGRDWNGEILAAARAQRERRRAEQQRAAAERPPPGRPPHALEAYTGRYAHPAYGEIIITLDAGRHTIRFARGQIGDLEYWQDDRFRVTWGGPGTYRGFVTFTRGRDGRTESVLLEYPAAEFTRLPADEDAILEVLARFERAFSERSGELYASSFSEDADWENAFGSRETGRKAIERRLTGVYTMYQEAEREDEEPRIVFINDDVAVADRVSVYHGQVGTRGQPLPPRRVRNTYVLHKVGGTWHIALYRGADLRESVDIPR